MSKSSRSFPILALVIILASTASGEDSDYAFTFGGETIHPYIISLSGDAKHPRPGDLAMVDNHVLMLDASKKWSLKSLEDSDDLLIENQGVWQPVFVRITEHRIDDKMTLINPLAKMSKEQIHNLRGVSIDAWNDLIAEKLKDVDPAQCCVSVSDRVQTGKEKALPALPAALQALRIDERSSNGIKDFSALKNLTALRYFECYTLSGDPIDVSLLKANHGMQNLVLSGNKLTQLQALAEFTDLRVLDLAYCRDLSSIDFASAMPNLAQLRLNRTDVTDLSPLANLNALTDVNANESKVAKLPNGKLPALKILRLISAPVTDESIATFRQEHPACKVTHGWEQALKSELADVTRLRIRSGGTCHRNKDEEKTLYEDKDPASIQKLVAAIAIDESQSGFHCMCCGTPSLEFYTGDALTLTLGFHHARSLRWPSGWPADGLLKKDSATFLVAWMADRGVKGPLNEIEAAKAQKDADRRKLELATAGMSAELRDAFKKGEAEFGVALKKEIPKPEDQVRILFRAFGASNNSWTMQEWIEQVAEAVLKTYDVNTLSTAAHDALLSNDRQVRRGAARFWESWQSPLLDWKPADAPKLHGIVIQIQQESRYYPLRQDALTNLRAWARELPPPEIDKRLAAGLHDPEPSVRRQAMLVAGELEHQPSAPDLMKVLKGEPLDIAALPDVPPAEKADVSEGFDEIATKLPEPQVAALALGYMRHADAKALIEAHEKESPMYAVALALLGDVAKLKPEHFRGQRNNKELQLAAVDAVIRCRGAAGLEFALNYQQATHWWEEERVAERLSAMLLNARAPGADLLQRAKSLKDLKAWYAQHGAAYFDSLRK